LYREEIIQQGIVTISPDVNSSLSFYQLGRYPDPVGSLTERAFEDVPHPKFPAHLLNIDPSALVGER
jgi:hypothetical protein